MTNGETRLVSIEVSKGLGSPELDTALAGLRRVVEDLGGQFYDRRLATGQELDLTTDEGLAHAAQCVEYMRQSGLLAPGRRIADLTIGTENPQRFATAEGYKGVNKLVMNDLLFNLHQTEQITDVVSLFMLGDEDLLERRIGPKKQALLRQALLDSGMPKEYPWPIPTIAGDYDCSEELFLRHVVLIAPNFPLLPYAAQSRLARYFIDIPWNQERLTGAEQVRCAEIYATRRGGILHFLSGA